MRLFRYPPPSIASPTIALEIPRTVPESNPWVKLLNLCLLDKPARTRPDADQVVSIAIHPLFSMGALLANPASHPRSPVCDSSLAAGSGCC